MNNINVLEGSEAVAAAVRLGIEVDLLIYIGHDAIRHQMTSLFMSYDLHLRILPAEHAVAEIVISMPVGRKDRADWFIRQLPDGADDVALFDIRDQGVDGRVRLLDQ